MFAVGVDVSNGRSTVAVLGARRKVIMKPFEVRHTADDFFYRFLCTCHPPGSINNQRLSHGIILPKTIWMLKLYTKKNEMSI